MPAVYHKSGGVWSKINAIYHKSTTWATINAVWHKVGGVWVRVFSGVLVPAITSTVTISTNSSTYPATLTGTNYHWNNSPTSLTYQFYYSTDNIIFYTLTSAATATNPGVGSSNTNTHPLVGSDFASPTTYFKYAVTASNSAGSSTSVSSSVGVTYPAPTIATGSWSGTQYIGYTLTYTVGASTNAYSQVTEIRRNDAYQTLLASGTGATVSYTSTADDNGYNLYAYTTVYGYGGSAYCAHVNTSTLYYYPAPTASNGSWAGGTTVGTTAIYNVGTFTNTTTYYTYIKRADAYNTLLTSSINATTTLYTLTSADVGYQLYAYSVAYGPGGSASSSAVFTPYITAPGVAPSVPSVSGDNLIIPQGGHFFWSSSTGTAPIGYVFTIYDPNNSLVYSTYGGVSYATSFAVGPGYFTVAGVYVLYIYASNAYGTSGATSFNQYMS